MDVVEATEGVEAFLTPGADRHLPRSADLADPARTVLHAAAEGDPRQTARPVPPSGSDALGCPSMPGITLTVSGERSLAIETLAEELTELTSSLLGKRVDETVTMFRFIAHEDWYVAGRSLKDWKQNSFKLEVTVTDETCTKEQKAAFHRAAFDLLAERIGNVHPVSNIHVIDCRGSAYGYGGMTQELRSRHPQ